MKISKKITASLFVICFLVFTLNLNAQSKIKYVFERPVEVVQNNGAYPESQIFPINDSLAFRMEQVEVTSLQQLKQLLGVEGIPEDQLLKGDAGLIGAFLTQDLKMAEFSWNQISPAPTVYLVNDLYTCDSLEKSAKKFNFDLSQQVFSMSSGKSDVIINEGFFINEDNAKKAADLGKYGLTHELAHLTDKAVLKDTDYGADKTHVFNEITFNAAPFTEGWAEYHEYTQAELEGNRAYLDKWFPKVTEVTKDGKKISIDNVTGAELLQCEGIICQCLLDIAKEIPDGDAKMRRAFNATNFESRIFADFLKSFASSNPADVAKLKEILKKETFNKLSEPELNNYLSGSLSGSVNGTNNGESWKETGTTVIDGITWRTDNQGNRFYIREDGIVVVIDKNGERWETHDGITWIDSQGVIWHSNDNRNTWCTSRNGANWYNQFGALVNMTSYETANACKYAKYIVDRDSSIAISAEARSWLQTGGGNTVNQPSNTQSNPNSSNTTTGSASTGTNSGGSGNTPNTDSE